MDYLGQVDILSKTGEEKFEVAGTSLPITLLEFWQWSQSDLLNNTLRGVLAEFIVAKALGVEDKCRIEWDSYDLLSPSGLKIEVKSSAYLQSWTQTKYSNISFDIANKRAWNKEQAVYSEQSNRNSDFYVFCLLHHKDKQTVNVLDLSQWTFFVLKTLVLNEKRPKGKKIGLNALLKLNPQKCSFEDLTKSIEGTK